VKKERNVPALNPYHPTQSMDIPMNVTRMLWGSNLSLPNPFLLPMTSTVARPETPGDRKGEIQRNLLFLTMKTKSHAFLIVNHLK
jgi:hypothetical protein